MVSEFAVESAVREYFDRSLTVLWPFSDLALLWLRTMKKHLKHCTYDSVAKFRIEGVGINTIIWFSKDKNYKNIVYLSLKSMQRFTIGGTSPPSRLTIVRSETKVVASHSTNSKSSRWRRSINCEPLHCFQWQVYDIFLVFISEK